MFDALTDRFDSVFGKLRSRGKLHPKQVDGALADMRTALLDWVKSTGDGTDLGAVVRSCFQKERSDLRVVIDTQIRTVRELSSGALTMRKIPVFQVEPMTMSDGTVGAISPPSRRPMTERPPGRVPSSTPIVVAVVAVGVLIGGAVIFGSTRRGGGSDADTVRPASAAGAELDAAWE